MANVFILTNGQLALVERCKIITEKFNKNPALIRSDEAIAAARFLIEQASDASLPTQAYIGLQSFVLMHENEMSLPEHLRIFSKMP